MREGGPSARAYRTLARTPPLPSSIAREGMRKGLTPCPAGVMPTLDTCGMGRDEDAGAWAADCSRWSRCWKRGRSLSSRVEEKVLPRTDIGVRGAALGALQLLELETLLPSPRDWYRFPGRTLEWECLRRGTLACGPDTCHSLHKTQDEAREMSLPTCKRHPWCQRGVPKPPGQGPALELDTWALRFAIRPLCCRSESLQ